MNDLPNQPMMGVYRIRNTKTGWVYIGSSTEVLERLYRHEFVLRYRTLLHQNKKLARAWRTDGPNAFVFELMTIVYDERRLMHEEQFALDMARPNVYNVVRKVAEHPDWRRRYDDRA